MYMHIFNIHINTHKHIPSTPPLHVRCLLELGHDAEAWPWLMSTLKVLVTVCD